MTSQFKNKNSLTYKNPMIGIIGGGQLARMMILEAHAFGLQTYLFCQSPDEPAAQVCQNIIYQGDDFDKNFLVFLSKITHLTFESEFYNLQPFEKSIKKNQVFVFPSLDNLKRIQYRDLQKELLKQYHIPTSDFIKVTHPDDLYLAQKQLGLPFVLKKTIGGYDGYGTFILKTKNDLKKWLLTHSLSEPYIAEKWVLFKQELAITFIRSKKGDIFYYPLVKSYQVDHRCDWVIGPTDHPKLKQLRSKIIKLLNGVDYVGAITFELFESDQLLVNEMAPRVHNTAHYTLDAYTHSQFLMHLLSGVTRSTLPKPVQLSPFFAMINLIGPKKGQLKPVTLKAGLVHWYGKKISKPGRKMGHINYLKHSSPNNLFKNLLKQAQNDRKLFRS